MFQLHHSKEIHNCMYAIILTAYCKNCKTTQGNYTFYLFLLETGIWEVCGHGQLSFFEGTQVFVIWNLEWLEDTDIV